MLREPVIISSEFNEILDRLEKTDHHYFITGKAGTGKSTLLNVFKQTTRKRSVFLAPTGVAALHIQGQTLHSFFRFPPRLIDVHELRKQKDNKLYKKVQCIVIDEISMVRADMIDAINIFLQKNRDNSAPFGGVQMIFFGDLFQLPPVVASEFERQYLEERYESPYFFSAKIFAHYAVEMEMVELHKVYRQTDRQFIELLSNIRTRTYDYDDLISLNHRLQAMPTDQDHIITLAARNQTADRINEQKLISLPGTEYVFSSVLKGKFDERNPPAPHRLRLRKGAQIMFVKNDVDKRYVNGTLGVINKVDINSISVTIIESDQGGVTEVELTREKWEIIKYKNAELNKDGIETEVIGTFEQYPIQLAWAVTIHKSQGKTFDHVFIDLASGSFDHGQTYVALSRCRTLEGIYLKKAIRPNDILVDERIVDFYNSRR